MDYAVNIPGLEIGFADFGDQKNVLTITVPPGTVIVSEGEISVTGGGKVVVCGMKEVRVDGGDTTTVVLRDCKAEVFDGKTIVHSGESAVRGGDVTVTGGGNVDVTLADKVCIGLVSSVKTLERCECPITIEGDSRVTIKGKGAVRFPNGDSRLATSNEGVLLVVTHQQSGPGLRIFWNE